jgi:hypothetical protein
LRGFVRVGRENFRENINFSKNVCNKYKLTFRIISKKK